MEAWKVILLVAALPLLGAAGLAYMNGEELKKGIEARELEESRVGTATTNKAKLVKDRDKAKADIATKTGERDEKKGRLDQAKGNISDADLKIKTLNDDIKLADTEIERYTALRIALGQIDEIERKMAGLRTSIESVTKEVSNAGNLLAVARAKKEETQADIDRRVTENKNRKASIITKDIDTQIKAAYNDWGFVVIDAGDADGIVLNATLDIVRQGKPICKVLVTDLEPSQCSANIIRSSLMPGQSVQVGDSVIKAGAAGAAATGAE
ncbi:MAG: hypothetical protein ACI8UO_000115 [Verrucomicrobiales bacterium]|jgi:hypothetical protein